jgi:HD-GYP domain-containing protein (c-di-GMP phosphodiesterase class II)
MTPREAMNELQNGATHGQFDPELVESFVTMLMRDDPVASIQHAQDADFETKLEFERRVREMAAPH